MTKEKFVTLQDKVVLVTGASDGIGRAIAIRLGKEGVRLALAGRSQQGLEETARLCTSEVKTFVCDVRDKEKIAEMLSLVTQAFGGLDIVINNAGVWQKVTQLDAIDDEIIEEQVQTNLLGAIYTTKYSLPILRRQKSDTAIINIISKSGVTAQEGQSVYTATKYGVRGFTDVLSGDLKNTKIHVGAVYQAGTNTQMFAKTGEDFPLEKFTEPADLADAVAYMLTRPAKMWISELHVSYK